MIEAVYVVRCDRCGFKSHPVLEWERLVIDYGWQLLTQPRQHICPACVAKEKDQNER